MTPDKEISSRFNLCMNFAPKVSEFLVKMRKNSDIGIQKKAEIDLVTQADLGAERLIQEEISNYFPQDSILGEEGGKTEGDSRYQWIIDPLDGTTNYAHGLPLYGSCIALQNVETKKVEFGVFLAPALGDTYHAIRGLGAFKNKQQIHISDTRKLQDSLLVTGFPYDRSNKLERLLLINKLFLKRTRGVRRTGSAGLDLCWTSEGRFDGYWEEGLKPWDMAAGSIILQEAGGKITTYDGNEFHPDIPTVVASNGHIHSSMIEVLTDGLDTKDLF